MSRADRVAARLAERELDAAAGHRPRQRPLPDRLHRLERAAPSSGRDMRRFVTDFRYVEQARGRGRRTSTASARRRSSLDGARRRLARRARCGSGFEDEHMSRAPARAAARAAARPRRARARGRRWSRPSGRSRSRARSSAIRAAAALADDGLRLAASSAASSGAPSARWRSRSSTRCAAAAPSGPSFPRSSPRPSTARCRTPSRATSRSPRDTLVTLDIGRAARRLLLGLHAHVGDRRARRRPAREVYDARAARAAGRRSTRCAPGPSGREVDAVARDMIDAAGHGEHFGHGLGHGVGLEVHEAPRLARTGDDAAGGRQRRDGRAGRLPPGRGGVRIEDLVVVTEDGCDVISRTTKELVTVG